MYLLYMLYFVFIWLYLKWIYFLIIVSEISNVLLIEFLKISFLYKEVLFWFENGLIIVKEIIWILINMEININSNI